MLDSAFGNLLAIDKELAGTAFADPAAVVVELEFGCDLAGRNCVL